MSADEKADSNEENKWTVNPNFCPNLYTDEIMIHYDDIRPIHRTRFYSSNTDDWSNMCTRSLVRRYCPDIKEDNVNNRYGNPQLFLAKHGQPRWESK